MYELWKMLVSFSLFNSKTTKDVDIEDIREYKFM